MSNVKQGDKGTFEGRAVEVTYINKDETLNLFGTGENIGQTGEGKPTTNPSPWYRENVPVEQFTPDVPEVPPSSLGVGEASEAPASSESTESVEDTVEDVQ